MYARTKACLAMTDIWSNIKVVPFGSSKKTPNYFEFFLIKQSGNFFLKQFFLTNEDSGPCIWTKQSYKSPLSLLKFDICYVYCMYYLKLVLNYIYHIQNWSSRQIQFGCSSQNTDYIGGSEDHCWQKVVFHNRNRFVDTDKCKFCSCHGQWKKWNINVS